MFDASSSLRVANLTSLMWLREQCRAPDEQAASLFGIDDDTVRFYRDLSDVAIEALSRELDVSLFVPRFDNKTLPAALDAECSGHAQAATGLALHNIASLQALCDVCRHSVAEATWIYRINRETAEAYAALDHDQVVSLSRTLTACALLPRYDASGAARILDRPAGSRALFAAAYEPDTAPTGEAARRSFHLAH